MLWKNKNTKVSEMALPRALNPFGIPLFTIISNLPDSKLISFDDPTLDDYEYYFYLVEPPKPKPIFTSYYCNVTKDKKQIIDVSAWSDYSSHDLVQESFAICRDWLNEIYFLCENEGMNCSWLVSESVSVSLEVDQDDETNLERIGLRHSLYTFCDPDTLDLSHYRKIYESFA